MTPRAKLFGCPFDRVDVKGAVAQAAEWIERGDRLYQSVGVNLDHLLKMQREPAFAEMVLRCDQITADGQPIVWLSRWFGDPLPERASSIDLMDALLPLAAARGWGVFMLGARQSSLERAVATYTARYPGLRVVGSQHGYYGREDEPSIAERINASGAKILLIAITSPKKEEFVERNRDLLRVSYVLGVGGAFDIAAGLATRAPKWVQRAGFEWFWRFLQEPRRMGPRILDDLAFARYVAREIGARMRYRPLPPV